MLSVEDLAKVYGSGSTEVRALSGVTFSIGRGEVVLVVGSSGSGKSTLLNLMGLLDRPTGGRVTVDNIDTSGMDDGRLSSVRNTKLGFVFQFSNLLPDLTVLENVMLPGHIGGLDCRREAERLLESVGMSDQAHKRANQISGGQAQRAAIARGLVNRPALVLADEPTGNLDSATAAAVVDLLKSMAAELGQAFVVVTHDRHQFGEVDRVVAVRDGRMAEAISA